MDILESILTAIIDETNAAEEETSVGHKIFIGSVDPLLKRRVAIVVGIICSADVFRTQNKIILWEAYGLLLFDFLNFFIASRPKGVAALPRPNKLADTFMETASIDSSEGFLNNFLKIGLKIFDIDEVILASCAIFIIPLQKQIAPHIEKNKLIADLLLPITAILTLDILLEIMPNNVENITPNKKNHFILWSPSYLNYLYVNLMGVIMAFYKVLLDLYIIVFIWYNNITKRGAW